MSSIHVVYDDYVEAAEGGFPEAKEATDQAFEAVRCVIQRAGFNTANDDRAERLVEAIASYINESESR